MCGEPPALPAEKPQSARPPMPTYRYRLLNSDGDDLGPFVASHTKWTAGGVIPMGERYLKVKAVVAAELEDSIEGYLVVEPFELDADRPV